MWDSDLYNVMKEILLSQGKVALVDDEKFDELQKYKWSIDGSGYAQTNLKTEKGWRPARMHRIILSLIGREMADRINFNKLDNRLLNLRKCNASGNVRNRGINNNNKSGFKGVYFNLFRNIHQTYITADYKHIYIGSFTDPIEVAHAYDSKAKELFGEFACLNFPE